MFYRLHPEKKITPYRIEHTYVNGCLCSGKENMDSEEHFKWKIPLKVMCIIYHTFSRFCVEAEATVQQRTFAINVSLSTELMF